MRQSMIADGKIAIARIEIVLIVLFVMLGYGVWLAANQFVGGGLNWLRGSASAYQADAQVPLHDIELSHAKSMLSTHLDQIDRQRQERDAQRETLQQMREDYTALPSSDAITRTKTLTMPVEMLRSYFTAREQRIVAQETAAALAAQLDVVVSETLSLSDTLAASGLSPADRMLVQARLKSSQGI